MRQLDKINEIEGLLEFGHHAQVKRDLRSLQKSQALGPEERMRISEIYRNLGDNAKALKILGPELSPQELQIVSQEELKMQVRLAYMLQHIGAQYASLRLFDNLREVAKTRQIELQEIAPQYFRYLAGLYIGMHDWARGLKVSLKAQETLGDDRKEWRGAAICVGACLYGLGEFHKCREHFLNLIQSAKEDEILFKGHCHYRLGALYMNHGDYQQAEISFREAETYLKDADSRDVFLLYRCLFILHFRKNEKDKAAIALERIHQFSFYEQLPASLKIDLYYWISLLFPEKLSLLQQISARAHLSFSAYSYALGRHYPEDARVPLTMFFGAKYTPTENDVWQISEGQIKAIKYIKKSPRGDKPVLDLVAGCLFDFPSKGNIQILTSLQAMCLSAIIGAGDVGLSKWALIEFLYRQEFFQPKNGEERLKQLIASMAKFSLKIAREKNHFYLIPPEGMIIYISMSHGHRGPIAHLYGETRKFNRKFLEEHFNIAPTTAKKWIKHWQEEELISQIGKGKSVTYLLKS